MAFAAATEEDEIDAIIFGSDDSSDDEADNGANAADQRTVRYRRAPKVRRLQEPFTPPGG
jgi:hypothetical protein